MKEVVISLIFVLDINTGIPLGVYTGAFDTVATCSQAQKNLAELLMFEPVIVDGQCIETVIQDASDLD